MLYTIQEASNQLKISKVTIYKKIKNSPEFKAFIKVKNNTKFIEPEGLDWLRENIVNNNNVNQLKETPSNNSENIFNKAIVNTFNHLQDEYVNSLKQQISSLENYIKTLENERENKNYQLEEYNKRLAENNKLMENMQVLLNNYNKKQIVENIEQNRKWWQIWTRKK